MSLTIYTVVARPAFFACACPERSEWVAISIVTEIASTHCIRDLQSKIYLAITSNHRVAILIATLFDVIASE
jgi:hypothetical protein